MAALSATVRGAETGHVERLTPGERSRVLGALDREG